MADDIKYGPGGGGGYADHGGAPVGGGGGGSPAPYLTRDDLNSYPALRTWAKPPRTVRAPDTRGLGPTTVGPLQIEITAIEIVKAVCVRVIGRVPDRNTGVMIPLEYAHTLYDGDTRPACEIVRDALVSFMRHEIAEQIYVDGKRIFDPHEPRSGIGLRGLVEE